MKYIRAKLRASEWILLAFFAYLVVISPFFRDRPRLKLQPIAILAASALLLWCLAAAESVLHAPVIGMVRDWLPMPLTLLAFREMELFVPVQYNVHLETAWIGLDHAVLHNWGLKQAIESLGPLLPLFLELCYLLIYGIGTYCVAVLWVEKRRPEVDRFYIVLLTGTLLAYALFPYFPSRPPRVVFANLDPPNSHNLFRSVNLFLLRKATIHSGVFPSAHVSSAFSAAWAMFLVSSQRRRIAWGLLIYAFCVALATVYGRYHYVADALAGFAVSLAAGVVAIFLARRSNQRVVRQP